MRKLRYCVATSLDGFIAGPDGACDWIEMDPDGDFGSFLNQFDSLVMGRKTYEITKQGPGPVMPGMTTYVYSRTLTIDADSEVTIEKDAISHMKNLKRESGEDIWLFGGSNLFRDLLNAQLVDSIELSLAPIMLSRGIPLIPEGDRSPRLKLVETKPVSNGSISLKYEIEYGGEDNRGN